MTLPPVDGDFRVRMQQLEGLLSEVADFSDPAVRDKAGRAIQTVLDFHGAGLAAVVERLGRAGQVGREILDSLAGDSLVGSLLLLHGLHPVDLELVFGAALDGVRPNLRSHGGHVDFLGVSPDGTVRLRLGGNCNGCASSRATLRNVIEEAIYAAAPEVAGIDVEGLTDDAAHPRAATQNGFVPVSQLTARRRAAPAPDAAKGFGLGPGSEERCELCSAAVGPGHPHLVDLADRRLLCACDGCAILFTGRHSARYLRVPRRVEFLTGFRVSDDQWDRLNVPIGLAFFYHSTPAGRVVALYPGPAGATESTLPLEAWGESARENPVLRELEPDVEALLVNRAGAGPGPGTSREFYRVPIDECYRLVGLIRTHWRGLSGGPEVWVELGRFFAALKGRSVVVPAPAANGEVPR